MQMRSFIAVLAFAVAHAATVKKAYKCPGSLLPGQVTKDDHYWYVCRADGGLEPKGCVTDGGRMVSVGDRFNRGEHVILGCNLDEDGKLMIEHVACIDHSGTEIPPLTSWINGQSLHTCHKYSSGTLQEKLIGCYHDGQELALGGRHVSSELWSECRVQRDGRSARMEPVGCVDSNGQAHEWGSHYVDGNTRYYCKCSYDDMRCTKRAVSCIDKGREYTAYQLIEGDTNSLYRCMIPSFNAPKSSRLLVGCMANINGVKETKRIDCLWDDGRVPYQYVKKCVKSEPKQGYARDESVESSEIVSLSCLYDRIAEIKPGCFNKVGASDLMAGCARKGSDLEIVMLGSGSFDDAMSKARGYGLKPTCWLLPEGQEMDCC